jgi:hypothetical protein
VGIRLAAKGRSRDAITNQLLANQGEDPLLSQKGEGVIKADLQQYLSNEGIIGEYLRAFWTDDEKDALLLQNGYSEEISGVAVLPVVVGVPTLLHLVAVFANED